MQEYGYVICDKCKKNYATCHTVVQINGVRYEADLCQQCYMEEQLSRSGVNNFVDFLSNDVICPTCKTNLSDICDSSFVGCSDCYNVFRKEILSKIQAMHGTRKHLGKRLPKNIQNKKVNLSDRENMKEHYFLAREEGRIDDIEEIFNDYLNGGFKDE